MTFEEYWEENEPYGSDPESVARYAWNKCTAEFSVVIEKQIEQVRKQERILTARRCAEIADVNGAYGVSYVIRREFGLDGEGK